MSVPPCNVQIRPVRWLVACALACGLLSTTARAGPWIPLPGAGSVSLMLRRFDANKAFLPNQYGTSTQPASELRYTMLRITGEQGLTGRLALQYDLRAARIEKLRTHHGRRTLLSSSGLEDQEVGLDFGLAQRPHFADSIALNVIAAVGSANAAPTLGVGHTAIEPDLQIGFAAGRWRTSLLGGSRVFVDGAAAQLRAELDSSVRLSPRLESGLVIFYARTIELKSALAPVDRSELYNLLRAGLRLQYRITRRFRPFVEYEQAIAGQAIHAGRRLSVGVTYRY